MHFWKLQRWELYKNLSTKQSTFSTAFFPQFFFNLPLLCSPGGFISKEYKGQGVSQVQNSPAMDVIAPHCVLLFWGAVHGTGRASGFWVRKSLNSKLPGWCVSFLSSFADILSVPYPVFRFTGQMLLCTCAGILYKDFLWWMCQADEPDPKMHHMEKWAETREFLRPGRCMHTKPSVRH